MDPRILPPGRRRGPYPRTPDAPPSCPSCGGPLDCGPTRAGLVGHCPRPECPEWIVLYARSESGAPVVAERIARTARLGGQGGRVGLAGAEAG